MNSSRTTRNRPTSSTFIALAAVVAMMSIALAPACSSGRSEPEPKADTPAKMDAAVGLTEQTEKEADMSDDSTLVEEQPKEDKKEDKEEEKAAIKYEYPIRDKNNHIVKLETNYGDLVLELYRDVAPNHADSFLARVEEGFYDSLIFHRVIKGFMIQGGDPTGTGSGDPNRPGYNLDQEFSKLLHLRGTLSMARRGGGGPDDPKGYNTASCQFYVCHGDASFLDNQYTIFGHLLKGYDTLDKIATTKKGANDRPVEEIRIIKATKVS